MVSGGECCSGRTLVQDIPASKWGHEAQQQASRWYGTHEVMLDEGSLAAMVFGRTRLVVIPTTIKVRVPGNNLDIR